MVYAAQILPDTAIMSLKCRSGESLPGYRGYERLVAEHVWLTAERDEDVRAFVTQQQHDRSEGRMPITTVEFVVGELQPGQMKLRGAVMLDAFAIARHHFVTPIMGYARPHSDFAHRLLDALNVPHDQVVEANDAVMHLLERPRPHVVRFDRTYDSWRWQLLSP